MLNWLRDRKNHVSIAFIIIFVLLGVSLYDLTIVHGDEYYEKSISNRIKKIELEAPRGEILDRNGKLLATNKIGFTVELNSGLIPAEQFSEIAIKMIDFLNEQGESHIEFPIFIENGVYKYRFDENIKDWLLSNGYDETWTAKEVFEDIRSANYIDEALSDYEAYRILFNQGKYMPISTAKMLFLDEIYKTTFLKMYGLEADISASDAFKKIRSRSEFRIDEKYSDEDAYKILIFRHTIKEQGYLKYEPIVVSPSVSKETAVLVQEKGFDFPGLSIVYDTIRTYPNTTSAAHILGYMGKIATEAEIETYVKQLGYKQNQIIGKTGIEGVYEEALRGINGYKYIEVDVYGKYVTDVDENAYGLDEQSSVAGKDITLTIDLDLQRVLETSLEKALFCLQTGTTYESPWGNYQYSKYANAETAAGVVIDVKTGEVLASASYPSYDLNLFSTGISQEDWNALNPVNKRNPLAARPLYNSAMMMSVQPGSIYKMMTGYAALREGLNPYQKLYSDGYVEIGKQRFGCWYWNDYGGKHGPTDFFKAIEVSCNYYFFNIANGKDYYRNMPLNFKMNPTIMTEYSKLFGLDEKTGVEISEVSMGLPQPEKKKKTIEALLTNQLYAIAKNYFPEEIVADEEKLKAVVDEIVSWSDENPGRGAIITRLLELGSNPDYFITEQLADIIKYDYFNLMKWYESDTLNLSIGQGDHTYTPIQIARYIATIANDGYLNELTLIKKIGDTEIKKNAGTVESFDTDNSLDVVRQAMRQVISGTQSSVSSIFKNFPIPVAAKTGTAQKEGLIPPLDEVAYLTEYLSEIAPNLNIEEVEAKTIEIIKLRSEEMAQLEKERDEATTEEEKAAKAAKLEDLIQRDYLNKGTAMRSAIKALSNDTLTDDQINQFRLPYDNYSWFVSFAPYENPEIAVVIFIPQGGQGYYSAPVARDVYAEYFKLTPPVVEVETIQQPKIGE
ncbi:MAG: penicillin-binding protein [Firmicutes bacterium]|nr:penicillin-binding protein [Bacillota bacterium]